MQPLKQLDKLLNASQVVAHLKLPVTTATILNWGKQKLVSTYRIKHKHRDSILFDPEEIKQLVEVTPKETNK